MLKLSFKVIALGMMLLPMGLHGAQKKDDVRLHGRVQSSEVISLDGPDWLISADPKNVGRQENWWTMPRPDAKTIRVPGAMQETLKAYYGVAWYWKDIQAPANPDKDGRYLLRFWMAQFVADVWVNGQHAGSHEGGEAMFIFDVTGMIKPKGANRIAVRILNTKPEPIDGIELGDTPRGNAWGPISPGAAYNYGGITDSVELLVTPAVRVEDLFVHPDPKSGKIHIQANLRNAGKKTVSGVTEFCVAPAASGETLQTVQFAIKLRPGDTRVEAELTVKNHRLWDLNDPYLYRVTARTRFGKSNLVDEQSTRCGFRDFRFENGYFRLNGRRVFLKCSHSVASSNPVGFEVPHDPDILRKDLLQGKVMGFNMIRGIFGLLRRYQVDLADEIGLMVYDENMASWGMGWSLSDRRKMGTPQMLARYDNSAIGMIKRDRNHPSVVMWGLLNENFGDSIFYHAIEFLPTVRALDDSRVVMLSSGRLDLFVAPPPEGLVRWSPDTTREPNVMLNESKKTVEVLGGKLEPGQLSLDPGAGGEYSVIRWTAPADGEFALSAAFSALHPAPTTTDIHVFSDKTALFDDFLNVNGKGGSAQFSRNVSLKSGANLYVIVGQGNNAGTSDTTGVALAIKSKDGKTYDPSKDFSTRRNPNGPWAFGSMPAGPKPDPGKFVEYRVSRSAALDKLGSLANPGSSVWEDLYTDGHYYQGVPTTNAVMNNLRTVETKILEPGHTGMKKPVFISEYGVGSAMDFPRLTRHFEEIGKTTSEDAEHYRKSLDRFMQDWKKWNLADTFASPEDYFTQCVASMAGQRLLGINAIRANPNVIGYSLTGTHDQVFSGEGLTTDFRDLKPGTVDAVFEGFYPLRWCLFTEPVNAYRNRSVHFDAVLANEDVLKPGRYQARVQIIGPGSTRIMDKKVALTIPESVSGREPSFALPVFSEDVVMTGAAGKYAFFVDLESGGAACGSKTEFNVVDAAELPKVKTEVLLWSDNKGLEDWLLKRGIKAKEYLGQPQTAREVILVAGTPAAGGADGWCELARRIARGSYAIFLCPGIFAKDGNPVGWMPMVNKGKFQQMSMWVYHKDDWCKAHPIFDGLPTGLMDYTTYRELIWDKTWADQDPPAEVVAGSIDASGSYSSGLTMAIHKLGEGRFVLNTFWLLERINLDPQADRVTLNMLNYAGRDIAKPLAPLPPDFDKTLKAFGYKK